MKYKNVNLFDIFVASLPVRGAWIEIYLIGLLMQTGIVAPRKGSVD